ncbi:MAG: aldehyde dehydrogenase family protein, partial [Halieaceae bacterium]
ISKTLDLAASCSSDNSVLVFDSVYDELVRKLEHEGGYVVNEEEKLKLQNTIWQDGHLNTAIVAQPAYKLAGMAGIELAEGKQFFIVPETGAGADHPFSGEKLSVVMALYKVEDIQDAIRLTNEIQAYQGQGHSCGIYSYNDDNIMSFAHATKTSRVMVNQPQAASNSGNLWNGMRQTFSLGCGSWGGNATNNNITWRDLINETWVSKPLAQIKVIPDDAELFGDVMAKFE